MIEIIFPSIPTILCLTSIGAFFGLMLSIVKLKLQIDRDPRFEKILNILPGANCGACGQPGCSGYASKIVQDKSMPINLCPVASIETIKNIASIMGVTAEVQSPKVAVVNCQGDNESTKVSFLYDGPHSCSAAQLIRDGFKVCPNGCLGLGDCETSCPFNAIHIDTNGLPVIDIDKCTGCGKCIESCPRGILSLLDKRINIHITCRNKEKASILKKGCSVGCIACKRCIKACKQVFTDNPDIETAIEIIDFLAVIDYEKCIDCGKCAEICPQGVIDFKKPLAENHYEVFR